LRHIVVQKQAESTVAGKRHAVRPSIAIRLSPDFALGRRLKAAGDF